MHIDLERRKIILQKIKSYLGMKRGTWTPTDKWWRIYFLHKCAYVLEIWKWKLQFEQITKNNNNN